MGEQEATGRQGVRWTRVLRWIAALLILALLGRLVIRHRSDLGNLRFFTVWELVFVCILFVLYFGVRAYQFFVVLLALGCHGMKFREWFATYITGRFANTLLGQSGAVYRAVVLKKRHQFPYTSFISADVFAAWFDVLFSLLLALVSMAIFAPRQEIGGVNAQLVLLMTLVVCTGGPVVLERGLRRIKTPWKRLDALRMKLHGMFEAALKSLCDLSVLMRMSVATLVSFALGALFLGLSFLAIGCTVSVPAAILFLALFKLSTVVVITPGNLGIRELAYGLLSAGMGIGMSEGVLASLIVRALHYLALFPLGLFFVGREIVGARKAKSGGGE